MEIICTIKDLIDKLNNSDSSEHGKIISNMQIPKEEFLPFAFWKENEYSRNCIEKTKDYELILLCWNSGDETPVHGHDGQDCWVYLVDGEITETRYKADKDDHLSEIGQQTLKGNKLTYMRDEMGYHSIKNHSKERAMTLHIYALPIEECEVYNTKKETFVNKEMEYDTIKKTKV